MFCLPVLENDSVGKSHSCDTTLRGLIEDWKQAVDSKQSVYVLSDMSITPSTI